ncbi:MAG: aldo/keto reductase [Alphaproteobacteria bacterium]|nr:MAG: aldo/keto reductase [Alphaproteobacteria bacterium]
MGDIYGKFSRRHFLGGAVSLAALAALPPLAWGQTEEWSLDLPDLSTGPIKRKIPSTGEEINAIGLGTWVTFNIGDDPLLLEHCRLVMTAFFAAGGGMIDSSPMYGTSEAVIGRILPQLEKTENLFAATKVWTDMPTYKFWQGAKKRGILQMEKSRKLWSVPKFDLMQVHNLADWETQLDTLFADKEAGKIRYVGVTTSHGLRHEAIAHVMKTRPIDFVQFTYNIVDRVAEKILLPLAAERGIAVIANMPFRHKQLFDLYGQQPLPDWAGEIDCHNWAQFFLKFVINHPHVTCAIPATRKVGHMLENVQAMYGRQPDQEMRARMAAYVANL